MLTFIFCPFLTNGRTSHSQDFIKKSYTKKATRILILKTNQCIRTYDVHLGTYDFTVERAVDARQPCLGPVQAGRNDFVLRMAAHRSACFNQLQFVRCYCSLYQITRRKVVHLLIECVLRFGCRTYFYRINLKIRS